MRNFQQKRRWRNILESRPVLGLLAILILAFIWSLIGLTAKMRATAENREMVEVKIAELNERKEKFSSDIAKLETPEGVEESIREKFGLARDGEGVIVIVEDQNPPPDGDGGEGGWFSFFKKLFR